MDGHADVTVDVAIVGVASPARGWPTVLARDGYAVLVLERQTSYRDKVRGEVLCCSRVAEIADLWALLPGLGRANLPVAK